MAVEATHGEATHGEQERIPAEPGLWIIVGGDLLLFTLFFATVAHYRAVVPDIFAEGRASLSLNVGVANTLILLTGSWFVVRAVRLFEQSEARCSSAHLLRMNHSGRILATAEFYVTDNQRPDRENSSVLGARVIFFSSRVRSAALIEMLSAMNATLVTPSPMASTTPAGS